MHTRAPLLAALALSAPALADAPQLVPVQGHLTDATGVPIDETLDVTFTLYDDASGSTALWTETQAVDFDQGAFTAYLGAVELLDLAVFRDNGAAWLGVKVGTDPEMPPYALGTAAYAGFAQHAGDADTVGGYEPFEIVDEALAARTAGEGLLDTDGAWSVDRSAVESWARDVCVDSEEELTALLDDDYGRSAGTGLLETGNTWSVNQELVEQWAGGVCFDTEDELTALLDDNYMPAGAVPDWSDVQGVPADLADGDDDTTYTAGAGLTLDGTAFSVQPDAVRAWAREAAFDTEAELTALLDDDYMPADAVPAWTDIQGVPAGLDDGDDDTTYSAGAGLTLDGTAFSVDPGKVLAGQDYTQVVRVVSSGLDADPMIPARVWIDGEAVHQTSRSYGVVAIDRATGAVVHKETFDVYSSTVGLARAAAMADLLAGFGPEQLVVVNTYDEPAGNRRGADADGDGIGDLEAQIYRCGGSQRVFDKPDETAGGFWYRSAYLLVGVCGDGEGTGIEYYEGARRGDPQARIDLTFVNIDGNLASWSVR